MKRLLRWITSHRSFAATGVLVVALAAVLAAVGFSSSGYQAQRVNLGDGTVWVVNDGLTAIGRANPQVLQLNSAVRSTGADLDVLQDPSHVLLLDRVDATIGVVNTATASVAQTVPLPPNSPDVLLAKNTAVVVSGKTGEFWSVPVSGLSAFDATSQADLSLGANISTGLTPNGTLVAYSADSGVVSRVDDVSQFGVSASAKLKLSKNDGFEVATIGQHWAVLDTTSSILVVDGRRVDLAGRGTGRLALQTSSDTGGSVLVASSSGLLSVPFTGGSVSERVAGRTGTPARPLVTSTCSYAAWADGTGWNTCTAAAGTTTRLASMGAGSTLAFAVNGEHVVLNDSVSGSSWAVQRQGQLIDNWSDLIQDDKTQQEDDAQNSQDQQKLDPQQKPPVAVPDTLGARPGRATTLPVLLNDYDPNGDPLAITSVGTIDKSVGRLDVIGDHQQLLLTLEADASGVVTFDYTISDGRGGSSTAKVTVTVKGPGENTAPVQARPTTATVASGGRVTVDTLGDWIDPEGDPFYLTDASGGGGGTVTFKPTGELVYQDRGDGPSTQEIVLSVSDGSAVGRGRLTITVGNAGSVAITAASFTVDAYAGEVTTVNPMQYASGGTGALKLNSVPSKPDVTITPSYSAGTFTFLSTTPNTYNLEYTVTDGDKTATGTVRVDVEAQPAANAPPITTPKTVFVESLSTQNVDITTSDFDPAGNVLMVTSVAAPEASSGVQVQSSEQRYLRITLTAPLTRSVAFTYTVSNGLADAQGLVTVVEIPRPARLQPPIATNDQVTARVGDAINIDVLANDEQPDGEAITLEPELVRPVSAGGGLLFVSGTQLRYLAPKTPGNFTAVYAVDGPDGQRATAEVGISVREADTATNNPPVPQTLTARVVAGQTVRIQVPLDDIDPDGDSVQLLGVDTNPQKGSVASVGATYLDYTAGSYSAGTDTFTYTVIDGLGARATGTIRVGIAARADGSRDPIAVADSVTMRPGGSILVRVLANDSDPDGGALTVTSVKPNEPDVTAEILAGGVVRVTPPKTAGSYGLVYTVTNASGGSSSNFITVKVDAKAALNYPEAQDSILTLNDILKRKTVDVNVLANVFFADGNVSTLGLGLQPGYGDTATVLSNHRIRVTITDQSQIIPFFVTHPDDPSIKAYAFIKVPGFNDALPQINEAAPALTVQSEKPLTIDLNKYVIAAGSNGVRLTDSGTVRATHSDGGNLVVNSTTLTFTSSALYFGQASISFQVTDGTSASDPAGHKATLVLPIQVTARANQPPVFNGTSLELEPGSSQTLDLTRLTTYPYANDLGQLAYSITSTPSAGLTARLSGHQLTVTVAAGTAKGTSGSIGIAVRDSTSTGQAGAIALNVVESTRPLAIAASDSAVVRRGATTTIDVLANDQATNPFPGQPLRVLGIRGLDGSSLPAGVTVTPSSDNSQLVVSVASSAKPGNTNLQYQLADVTNDPSRYVYGSVTISVQDVPDSPTVPIRSGSFIGGQLTLSWAAPSFNNSPITSYVLTGTSGANSYSKDCGLSTVCTLTDLDPGQQYQFSVVAINAIGTSASSPASISYSADYVPTAPTGVTVVPSTSVANALVVSWPAVARPARGTAVTGYVVEVAGVGSQTTTTTTTTFAGLTPGSQYSVQVYATNSAQVSSSADWSRSGSVTATAIGVPSAPSVSATTDAGGSGDVTLTHGSSDPAGASTVSYSYGRFDGTVTAAPACTTGSSKPGTSVTSPDTSTSDGATYTYFAYADNGYFCSASSPANVVSLKAPTGAYVTLNINPNGTSGGYDVQIGAIGATGGTAQSFEATDGSGNTTLVSQGDFLTSMGDQSVYGHSNTWRFVACRTTDGQYCSAPVTASATPVTTRATITSCTVGTPLGVSDPANTPDVSPNYSKVEFLRSGVWQLADSGGAYTVTSTVPDDATQVRITTTLTVGGIVYRDLGNAIATCQ
ncbi:Ig-like domain-containing protein [Frondihabitans cladoniiphilus]|uniref:Ig-like domain-containing protein n=1 Tax=Frondihabitans cladoniiphilus TaxID=715785 RepID=A0ABP8VNB4_9MICO